MELRLHLGQEPLSADGLRRVPIGRISAWANAPKIAATIREHIDEPGPGDAVKLHGRGPSVVRPLEVPDHRPYGDEFYKRVAAQYAALAQHVGRPAAELAEVNDEPVTNVHSWVKEARRRGFLPPGRKGKAG
ncbi:MAG TPA: hypothetical protein VE487_07145 [Ilumatobacter sp.]|nr:hypothetical protein [Ilumatobacter sp.]